MTERLSRRALFKRALKIGGAGALAADVGFATRVFQPSHEITSDVFTRTEKLAEKIAGSISFPGYEELTLEAESRLVKVRPNAKAFAQTLLLMSYREGGQPAVDLTSGVIQSRGLEILFENPVDPFAAGMTVPVLDVLSGGSFHVQIKPSVASRYYQNQENLPDIIDHELYHIHQLIKDGIAVEMIRDFLAGGVLASVCLYPSINDIFIEKKEISRRVTLDFIAGLVLLWGLGNYLSPTELQAHIQTGSALRKSGATVVTDPAFDQIRNRLFTFEEVLPSIR